MTEWLNWTELTILNEVIVIGVGDYCGPQVPVKPLWGGNKNELDHQPRLDAWDKRLDLVHWEDLEGSGGEGGGRGDQDGEHM